MRGVIFVTGNPNKLREARQILGDDLQSRDLDLPEPQTMDLDVIVRAKLRAAYAAFHQPVIVEDVAVDISCLNGFPGTLVKFWEKCGGYEHALIIAAARGDSRMTVISGVGYKYGPNDGEEALLTAVVRGTLVQKRGENGWGLDPYFVPDGETETFAEMGSENKLRLSHRGQALRNMRDLIQSNDHLT